MVRAKLAEEATQHLRTEAAQAAQRAISAEVKVEVLQKAVQQAEERVATLEMQVAAETSLPLCKLAFFFQADETSYQS